MKLPLQLHRCGKAPASLYWLSPLGFALSLHPFSAPHCTLCFASCGPAPTCRTCLILCSNCLTWSFNCCTCSKGRRYHQADNLQHRVRPPSQARSMEFSVGRLSSSAHEYSEYHIEKDLRCEVWNAAETDSQSQQTNRLRAGLSNSKQVVPPLDHRRRHVHCSNPRTCFQESL